jgi:hypothetical protein
MPYRVSVRVMVFGGGVGRGGRGKPISRFRSGILPRCQRWATSPTVFVRFVATTLPVCLLHPQVAGITPSFGEQRSLAACCTKTLSESAMLPFGLSAHAAIVSLSALPSTLASRRSAVAAILAAGGKHGRQFGSGGETRVGGWAERNSSTCNC